MYEVPDFKLIPQQLDTSCWYASLRMLIEWKQSRTFMSGLITPAHDAQAKNLRDGGSGIINSQIIPMARRLGLRPIPPMTPTINAIETWLRMYGPLWVNGVSHIVVIAGINGDKVKVYDPWPRGQGKIDWRSFADWYIGGKQPLNTSYTVKPGDTLTAIAKANGLNWFGLYNHPNNKIFRSKRPDPNRIFPDDIIMIPSGVNSSPDSDISVETVFLYAP